MKTDIKKLDNSKVELNIEVGSELIKAKFDKVYGRLQKEIRIPGFRPGKAPRDIIQKHHANLARQEALKELVPEAYKKAIEKENLDVVDLPKISDIQFQELSLSFKATVEIKPCVKIKDYKGLKIKFKKTEVTKGELTRYVDSLKENRQIKEYDERFAKRLGYPDIMNLEKALESQILIQKESANRQDVELQIIQQLIKGASLSLSSSLVNRRFEELLSEAKVNLALQGKTKEEIATLEPELETKLKPEAENQVRIFLILEEIAKQEGIPQDNQMSQRVMEFLLAEANWEEVVK